MCATTWTFSAAQLALLVHCYLLASKHDLFGI